jgi:hypothetical protein
MMANQTGSTTSPPSSTRDEPPSRYLFEAGFAALLFVIGAFVFLTGLDYGVRGDDALIGPGAAPLVLGVLLSIGALVIFASSIRKFREAAKQNQDADRDLRVTRRLSEAAVYTRKSVLRPMSIIALVGLGFSLIPLLGVIVSMSLTVVVLAMVVERLRLFPALIMGIVAAIVLWLIFVQLLSVRLPTGLVGL